VEGDIGRMNTVFRFYLQAWSLWGVLAGVALAGGVTVLARLPSRPWVAPVRIAWLGAALGFVLLALLFPIYGTQARVRDRFVQLPLTLDGLAYQQAAVYQDERGPIDLAAEQRMIEWLRANVPGTPVVMEGLTPTYRWSNRVAVHTGLPAVIGWDWHQRQQRWGAQTPVMQRIQDVDRAYRSLSPDDARRLFARYGVEYMVVGQVERLYYPAAGLAKFAQMPDLTPVYTEGPTTIYQVNR
jgi:uncharacterized membrane protein